MGENITPVINDLCRRQLDGSVFAGQGPDDLVIQELSGLYQEILQQGRASFFIEQFCYLHHAPDKIGEMTDGIPDHGIVGPME
jgi:hypothetical protein